MFSRGRDLAAWLGLVPRQATTGGKPKLLGITKRGSKYLRKLLIQGARAALPSLSRSDTFGQLVARASGASSRERRRGGAREQARADRLGGAAKRSVFEPRHAVGGVARDRPMAHTRRHGPEGGLQEVEARWPDSRSVSRKPTAKMALDAGPFMRPGTRGSPSWPGRCPETGYVDADCPGQMPMSLAGGAGHTLRRPPRQGRAPP